MSKLEWKPLNIKHIVQNKWIDFKETSYELPDGRESSPYYEYSRRSFSIIIARDTEGKFLCVKQYRYGIHEVTTEFPAGGIETGGNEYDKVSSEDALKCAQRELQEETGYVSNEWTHLITVPSNATIADNYAYCYFADNCMKQSDLHLDDTEFLEVISLTKEEIDDLIKNNHFQQAIHIMAWELWKNQSK